MTIPASIGLIIPSGNRLTEPQFNHYLPPASAVHITRLRMTGQWRKPLSELKRSLTEAAEALSDIKPDMIVFHCTANSMENGLAHEAAFVETIAASQRLPDDHDGAGDPAGIRSLRHQETRAHQSLRQTNQRTRSELPHRNRIYGAA